MDLSLIPLVNAALRLALATTYLHAGLPSPDWLGDLHALACRTLPAFPDLFELLQQPAPPEAPQQWEIRPEIVLGTSGTVAQFGLLGHTVGPDGTAGSPASEPVYLDTNGCEFIVIAGNTSAGKTTTLAVCQESHNLLIPNINHLYRPSCVVSLHLHNDNHDLLAAVGPNSEPRAVARLRERYDTVPMGLRNVHRLILPSLLDAEKAAFPQVPASPLCFLPGQLSAQGWELLMGLEENQGSAYGGLVFSVLSEQRERVTLASLRQAAGAANLRSDSKEALERHLRLAGRFVSDREGLDESLIEEGNVLVVEIRDSWVRPADRVVLAAVALEHILRVARRKGVRLLLCIDEAHHVLVSPALLRLLEVWIKERRHLRLGLVLSDQDLLRLPVEWLAQASVTIAHRVTSEKTQRHLVQANPLWRSVPEGRLLGLPTGYGLVLASGGVFGQGLEHFVKAPRQVAMRERVSHHGGHTRLGV